MEEQVWGGAVEEELLWRSCWGGAVGGGAVGEELLWRSCWGAAVGAELLGKLKKVRLSEIRFPDSNLFWLLLGVFRQFWE